MSDILPVCLQDFLYSRKSELRKHKIIFIMKYMPGSGLEAAACFCGYVSGVRRSTGKKIKNEIGRRTET